MESGVDLMTPDPSLTRTAEYNVSKSDRSYSMGKTDDPNKRGKQDRSKVSNQPHEVNYTTDDLEITKEQLRDIKEEVGTGRKNIEEEVRKRKKP